MLNRFFESKQILKAQISLEKTEIRKFIERYQNELTFAPREYINQNLIRAIRDYTKITPEYLNIARILFVTKLDIEYDFKLLFKHENRKFISFWIGEIPSGPLRFDRWSEIEIYMETMMSVEDRFSDNNKDISSHVLQIISLTEIIELIINERKRRML